MTSIDDSLTIASSIYDYRSVEEQNNNLIDLFQRKTCHHFYKIKNSSNYTTSEENGVFHRVASYFPVSEDSISTDSSDHYSDLKTQQIIEPAKSLKDLEAPFLNCGDEKFLLLEKSADADLEKGFQSDYVDGWNNEYRIFNFFREITYKYEEAASLALSRSKFTDTIRILEKLAIVYAEKPDMSFVAIDRLFSAWQLCTVTGDLKRSEAILQKLHLLTDQEVSICRAETGCCSVDNLITALLYKAEILEITNPTQPLEHLYREAGQLCMQLHEEGVCLGHLNPTLIAGLCFEKSVETQEQARIAYEKTIQLVNEFDMAAPALYKLIYGAPFYLHISLAGIKSERKDVFAAVIHKQVKLYISCLEEVACAGSDDTDSSVDSACDDFVELSEYIKALVSVGSTLLGPESPEMIEIKKTLKNYASLAHFDTEIPSSTRQHYEATHLALFTATKQTPVYEIIRQLEDRTKFLGP